MLAVNFSLVSQQTTGIGEALKFGALRLWAPIWSIVFVHVFATIQSALSFGHAKFMFNLPPLAFAVEVLVSALGRKVAIVFAIVCLRRITSLDHALHLVT
jgi:hypothetical protein